MMWSAATPAAFSAKTPAFAIGMPTQSPTAYTSGNGVSSGGPHLGQPCRRTPAHLGAPGTQGLQEGWDPCLAHVSQRGGGSLTHDRVRVSQRLAKFIDGPVQSVVEVTGGVRRPDFLSQFVTTHELSRALQQSHEELKRLPL